MKLLTYATENTVISHAPTAALTPCCVSFPIRTMSGKLSVVSLAQLVDGLVYEAPDGLRNECSLSRREAPSSSQLGPYRLL